MNPGPIDKTLRNSASVLNRHSHNIKLNYKYHSLMYIGADVFKLGLLQSDTDYTVYAYGWGVPGLDMAYYAGRGFYHTTRDRYMSS